MKVEELRQQMEKKLQEEQKIREEAEKEEQAYLGHQKSGGRGYNNKSQNPQGQYQKKEYGSGRGDGGRNRKDDYREERKQGGSGRGSQGGKGYSQSNQYVKKPTNLPVVPSVEISDQDMEKKISQNFTAYANELEEKPDTVFSSDFFYVFDELQKVNGKTGSDIFFSFLNKIFDRSENEIE